VRSKIGSAVNDWWVKIYFFKKNCGKNWSREKFGRELLTLRLLKAVDWLNFIIKIIFIIEKYILLRKNYSSN